MNSKIIYSEEEMQNFDYSTLSPLFELIPLIKKKKLKIKETKRLDEEEAPWQSFAIKFIVLSFKLGIVIDFDWYKWGSPHVIFPQDENVYKHYDTLTLIKLITTIIQSERKGLIDDAVAIAFHSGAILQILELLESKVSSNTYQL